MKVVELAEQLAILVYSGHGDLEVFKSVDDEGNGYTVVDAVVHYTVEVMEREDLWVEDPRPNDADHVVIW